MVVNKFSYRMCKKIKNYAKFLLLNFFNEDHILNFFSSVQRFFLQTVHTQAYNIDLCLYEAYKQKKEKKGKNEKNIYFN